MKKFLIFFFVIFINNLFGSIIFINKIDNLDVNFIYIIYKQGTAYIGDYGLIERKLTFRLAGRKPVIEWFNVYFDEIIFRAKNGNMIVASKTLNKDFFIEAQQKLENENRILLDIIKESNVLEISRQNNFGLQKDKVFHILLGKDEHGFDTIVLEEQSSQLSELTDAAARSCVIL